MRSYLASFSIYINERTGGGGDGQGCSNSRPKIGGVGEVKTSPIDRGQHSRAVS